MKEQRTPEWFAARKGRVTGSKVGAILGLSPWSTPGDVLRAMVREYHGAEREFTGNAATEWGTANEPGAMLDYELETGNTIIPAFFEEMGDIFGASPDGYIGDDGLIEIKCPYSKRDIESAEEFKTLADQPYYYAQIQFQLYCTGRQWCDFYQWSPRAQSLERVDYDQAWIDENIPRLQEFHARYVSEIDNPAHLEARRKFLEAHDLLAEYLKARAEKEEADQRMKAALAALVIEAGEKNATIGKHKLTLVKRKGSVSYSRVVKDLLPDVDLEAYRGKGSEYWTLK